MCPSITEMLDSFPEGWKPHPGDKLIGPITGLETRTTEYGQYPIVTVRADDGVDFAFHAYHTVAKRELARLQPRVGDQIGIAYYGLHPTRNYERYRIVLERDTVGAAVDHSAREIAAAGESSPSVDESAPTADGNGEIPY